MATRQLTWQAAQQIAERAAEKSLCFAPVKSGPVPKGTTAEQIRGACEDAAFIALKMAGCLADDDARNAAAIRRAADAAAARHRAWCKATGRPF